MLIIKDKRLTLPPMLARDGNTPSCAANVSEISPEILYGKNFLKNFVKICIKETIAKTEKNDMTKPRSNGVSGEMKQIKNPAKPKLDNESYLFLNVFANIKTIAIMPALVTAGVKEHR